MHVGRPSQGGILALGEPEGAFEGALRLSEASLGGREVADRDRAAEDVGDVPGLLEPGQGHRVAIVRSVEVAHGPGRQAGQGRGRRADQVVVLGGPVEGPLGVTMVAAGSPAMLSASAARYISMDGGHPGELVASTTTSSSSGKRELPLDVVQPLLHAGELVAGHQSADQADGEDRAVAEHVVGEGLGPARESRPRGVPRAAPGSRARPGPRRAPTSPAASACRTASSRARRPPGTMRWRAGAARRPGRGARRAGARGARRRTGGGSGTSGAGRREAPRTGSGVPATPAPGCSRTSR